MARQVRIEYPGACYHIMARGNRLDPIFVSAKGRDQELFLETLEEACQQTGFRVWAWVLMKNHYHLVVETPEANLVSGMSWLQNTYTRRFNTRHKQWGRLFGDRYKSILIELDHSPGGSFYLRTLLDYVHLNPVRAGLVAPAKPRADSVLAYPWSSVSRGYALSPGKRPDWNCAEAGLGLFGFKDTARDRRRFVARLDARMACEDAERCGVAEIGGQTLNSSLRRGWYWGSESFKEAMLGKLEDLSVARRKEGTNLPDSHNYAQSRQFKDHHLHEAEAIIRKGIAHFGLEVDGDAAEPLPKAPRGDLSVVAIAWSICRLTTLPRIWTAQRLGLGSAGNVSERVRQFEKAKPAKLSKEVRAWKRMKL